MPPGAVLIGENGSGKTNLLQFFEMLCSSIRSGGLAEFVERRGGAGRLLFGSPETTSSIRAEIGLQTQHGQCEYCFTLAPRPTGDLVFTEEKFRLCGEKITPGDQWSATSEEGYGTSRIIDAAKCPDLGDSTSSAAEAVWEFLDSPGVYHFRDTSDISGFRAGWDADEGMMLRPDGWNLAPVLRRMGREDPKIYSLICYHLQSLIPNVDQLDISRIRDTAHIGWKAKGSNRRFDALHTSDGSLSIFALFSLLMRSNSALPHLLLLDEPELGLQINAIRLMGELIRHLARFNQCIIATQSVHVLYACSPDEFLILETEGGQTRLRRASTDDYRTTPEERCSIRQLRQVQVVGRHP